MRTTLAALATAAALLSTPSTAAVTVRTHCDNSFRISITPSFALQKPDGVVANLPGALVEEHCTTGAPTTLAPGGEKILSGNLAAALNDVGELVLSNVETGKPYFNVVAMFKHSASVEGLASAQVDVLVADEDERVYGRFRARY